MWKKFYDIPQLVFAVLTEKTGFMELLFVCYQAFHGVNPLLAHCTHLGLWYSNLARWQEISFYSVQCCAQPIISCSTKHPVHLGNTDNIHYWNIWLSPSLTTRALVKDMFRHTTVHYCINTSQIWKHLWKFNLIKWLGIFVLDISGNKVTLEIFNTDMSSRKMLKC